MPPATACTESFKAMLDADEKTGITAITGLDLGANLGIIYHIHTAKGFFAIRAECQKKTQKSKL